MKDKQELHNCYQMGTKIVSYSEQYQNHRKGGYRLIIKSPNIQIFFMSRSSPLSCCLLGFPWAFSPRSGQDLQLNRLIIQLVFLLFLRTLGWDYSPLIWSLHWHNWTSRMSDSLKPTHKHLHRQKRKACTNHQTKALYYGNICTTYCKWLMETVARGR